MMANLNVPTFCLITGASRGIGRSTAIELAKVVAPNSSFYLLARNKARLEETADAIKNEVNGKIDVTCISVDLSTEQSATKLCNDIFENIGDVARFSHAILVHNVASTGISKFARELDDAQFLQGFLFLNVTAPIVLTSSFFSCFGHGEGSTRKTIIQVTSDNATTPYKTMHIYGMVKAGRNMFFKVMALEEPEVRVLSYDPGAVDTEMYKETYESPDSQFVEQVKGYAKQSYFLQPEQSAGALIKALQEDKYVSAEVVRCYDVLGMKTDF